MNLYQYVRSQPISGLDPNGTDCIIMFKCTLTKGGGYKDNWWPKKNVRTCHYDCVETPRTPGAPTRRQIKGIGLLRCWQVPKGVVVQREKEHTARLTCAPCAKSYFREFEFVNSFPFGNCSRSKCKATCNKGGGAGFICKKLPTGLKQLCKAMVKLGKYNCKEICDAYCKNR